MASKTIALISLFVLGCAAQRSPYAGRRPVGYPEIEITTTTSTTTSQNGLGDRFGDDDASPLPSTTTQRLPIEALGDRDLVNRLSRLPLDKQPFWFINWKALEEHRKNPHTYPHKQTPFIDSVNSHNTISQSFLFRRR